MSGMDGCRAPAGALAFTAVCPLRDVPRLGARVIERPLEKGGNVAVFRTADDRVFALADRCPHKGGPLSQGIVHGDRVACPLHNWNVRLDTGTAVEPDQGYTTRYPARVANGLIEVALEGAIRVAPDGPIGIATDGAIGVSAIRVAPDGA